MLKIQDVLSQEPKVYTVIGVKENDLLVEDQLGEKKIFTKSWVRGLQEKGEAIFAADGTFTFAKRERRTVENWGA